MSPEHSPAQPRLEVLILGLGNILLSDDGLGVRAIERIQSDYELPPGVEAVDGGTLGLALLGTVCDVERLVLVDAIAGEDPPGTLIRLEADDVEPAVRERLSPHQIGVADLLDAMRLLDRMPREVVLLGLVPASLELDTELSPPVASALPQLVKEVVRELRRSRHAITPRLQSRRGDLALRHPELAVL